MVYYPPQDSYAGIIIVFLPAILNEFASVFG